MLFYLVFTSKGSEVVKRDRLKICSLSGFRGSNPLPCIVYDANIKFK